MTREKQQREPAVPQPVAPSVAGLKLPRQSLDTSLRLLGAVFLIAFAASPVSSAQHVAIFLAVAIIGLWYVILAELGKKPPFFLSHFIIATVLGLIAGAWAISALSQEGPVLPLTVRLQIAWIIGPIVSLTYCCIHILVSIFRR